MSIINPALQLAHTRLLVEPFGHLLAGSHMHTYTVVVLLGRMLVTMVHEKKEVGVSVQVYYIPYRYVK